MDEMNEKIEPIENGIKRNPDGTFAEGSIPNPNGRPKGSCSIVAALKKKLEEIPKDKKKTYLEYFIDQIMKKTVIEGDVSMMKDVIDRIDGKPKQDVNIDLKGEMAIETLEKEIKNLLNGKGTDNNSKFSKEIIQD